ncbi:MAG: 23S rRNA (pseudouridine(1915)-N(3))-methyltransferase RlmH [Alphaproteobacteria bacterium]|nr:23S rRNA (pseudouridine(1915)-N(3))-methyltransferase RlmH [Alphaproteobacteria bacterium]
MRIVIASVGLARGTPHQTLYDDYVRRLSWPVELREIKLKNPLPPAATRVEEGKALLHAMPKGCQFVALDRIGEALCSEALALRLRHWQDGGVKHIGFAIGGAEGLDAAVLQASQLRLSLGAMTWPHLLARVMLVEQLYRANSIIVGHPYHRE